MSSFTSEIKKLRNIQQHLERDGNTFLDNYSKSHQSTDLTELRLENRKLRRMEQGKLEQDIDNIINPLNKITNSLKNEDFIKLDIKTLKNDMTQIRSNIKNLNDIAQNSLEDLKKEEQDLLSDLQNFQKKIANWEKRTRIAPKCFTRSVSAPKNISKEVKAFMDFVESTGGHQNGWSVDDHSIFLRIRNKVRDREKLAAIIHAMLPDISENQVNDHEVWYTKYIELREIQKNSIKNWRATKTIVQNRQTVDNCTDKSCSNVNSIDYLHKEMVQEKLHVWKTEKLLRNKCKYEQQQLELEKIKERERIKKQKQDEIRRQVNNWKMTKKHLEEEEKIKKEEEKRRNQKERAIRANKLIKEFQNHDELFVQQKLQILHGQSKLTSIVHQKNFEEKSRNRSKLLESTQQWIMRRNADSNNHNEMQNLNVQTIPKLKMPEWRKLVA